MRVAVGYEGLKGTGEVTDVVQDGLTLLKNVKTVRGTRETPWKAREGQFDGIDAGTPCWWVPTEMVPAKARPATPEESRALGVTVVPKKLKVGDRVEFVYPDMKGKHEGTGTIVAFGPGKPILLKNIEGKGPWVDGSGSEFWWLDHEGQVLRVIGHADPAPVSEHARRKAQPMFRGALACFPDAIAEMARAMLLATEQHHPGSPLHWDFAKSTDHADCILRHQVDFDALDTDNVLHATKVFIRAGMQLQTLLEKRDPELHARRQAQREAAAKGER